MTDEQPKTRTRKRAAKKATAAPEPPDHRIAFLTPFRSPERHPADKSFPYRERAYEWQQAEYRRRGLPSFVSTDGRRTAAFSVSRAVNRAAKKAGPEFTHLMILPADCALPTNAELGDALHRASGLPQSTGWAPVWGATETLSRPATEAVLAGRHDARSRELHLKNRFRHCEGPLIVERGLFDRVGGLDERFEGWGAEDTAFRLVLSATAGEAVPAPPSAVCRCLWHPRDDEHFDHAAVARNMALLEEIRAEITQRDGPEEGIPDNGLDDGE